jgi:hypothetical protein
MEEKKVSTLFEEMRDDISNYVNTTLELGKLEVIEKISISASAVVHALMLSGALVIALFFMLITAAFYLSELFQNFWIGFGIIAAFALLVTLIIFISGKTFKQKFTSRVVSFLMKSDDNDEKKSKK